MRITIINLERNDRRYSRMELETFVGQLQDGTFRQEEWLPVNKEVCFAAEWQKTNGELKTKSINQLVLLSLENLRDMLTAEEYKRIAARLPYTLLCFLGHDGHSLHIVAPYDVADDVASDTTQLNAYRKLHYIYSSQLGTPLAKAKPDFQTCCAASYDPTPFYNPEALPVMVAAEPEETPEFRSMQEHISDYNYPEEIPGLSQHDSRMRRFHDCLDAAIEAHRDMKEDELYLTAVLEQLADGCQKMGLPQAFAARVTTFLPMFGRGLHEDIINSAFKTAYLRETLKAMPMKFTRPSALIAYKTEAYMKEHYTLRMNMMTGTPEYRLNAIGYGFAPLDQSARNTMTIKALKAGLDTWDKDLNRYIDSDIIPRYYPMEDYLQHLPRWDGKHDYVGELAARIKTDNPHWPGDFHIWMRSMVAQWLGKNRQYGNAIVPLLIGPQGSGKTSFCRRLLPGWLQLYYNDRLSMKNDNDIFIAMSSYALINIDEFDAMSKSQQPILKYLISKNDVKFRPPYGKAMEQRPRFASFIATTNNKRPLIDPTGSRRFICIYADEIDNSGYVPHDQIYAQLVAELEGKQRFWFNDEESQRIMKQNAHFQQVTSCEQMVLLTYLQPGETPADCGYVTLQDIMQQLEAGFPNFTITTRQRQELGKRLIHMGYEQKHSKKGSVFRMEKR